MGEKDISEKMLEAYNDVFADIVNVLLFNGELVVGADELEEGAPRSCYKVDGKLHEQERDVLKRLKDGDIRVACIGFENQSAPDSDMALRVIGYDGPEYSAQVYRKGPERYPVITLVLYFNYEKPWNISPHLKDRLTISKRFAPFVSDYTINVFQIADLTPEQVQLFRSDFREVADFFVQKKNNGDYKPEPRVLDHMHETLQLLSVMTKDHRILDAYQPDDPQGVPRTMCDVIDRIVDRSRNEGRQEGRVEGRREGRREGRKEINLLMKKLFAQKRFEDAQKATEDTEYCTQLLKEFAIV